MDSEVAITQSAEKLLNVRLSLSETLGSDWKKRCIFPNIKAALEEEGIKTLGAGQEISPGEEKEEIETFVIAVNKIFRSNESSHHAKRFTDPKGKRKAIIVGKIGKDTMYQVVKHCTLIKDFEGSVVAVWIPSKIGLVSENGQVFSIDNVIRAAEQGENNNDITFMEIAGRRHKVNLRVASSQSTDTLTTLPENHEQLGIFLHEVGHMLRKTLFRKDQKLEEASSAANQEFKKTNELGLPPLNPNRKLTPYQTRQIKANEERGAWAMGISLIKDAGNTIGLQCASPLAIGAMRRLAESCLRTYDQVAYTFSEHEEPKPVPTFSRKARLAARKLHRRMRKNRLSYSDLPSFDEQTGENLAKNPKETFKRLD